jgi:hypothetical protein
VCVCVSVCVLCVCKDRVCLLPVLRRVIGKRLLSFNKIATTTNDAMPSIMSSCCCRTCYLWILCILVAVQCMPYYSALRQAGEIVAHLQSLLFTAAAAAIAAAALAGSPAAAAAATAAIIVGFRAWGAVDSPSSSSPLRSLRSCCLN